MTNFSDTKLWLDTRIKKDQIDKYLDNGNDFIDDEQIVNHINQNQSEDEKRIDDILQKSLSINVLTPMETATLLNVKNRDIWDKLKETALSVKKKVYDNRIVTFAPLYLGNLCVNNCLYCGFREGNTSANRQVLGSEQIKKEVEILAGVVGHKRTIAVYGEHPSTDIDYIVSSIKTMYDVKIKGRNGLSNIRRVNVNAAPMSIDDLKKLHKVGIGTYQVFQETYSHSTYAKVHTNGTIKSDYRWRLYSMHRALEAGIDDVGIGALFGLYDWKFEVMGLLYHAIELEKKFGIGPHTVSFPRLEPACNTPFIENSKYLVSDEDLKKIITVIRLSIPYAGMIMTARENASLRKEAVSLGITQVDASSKIGIGAYSSNLEMQETEKQQFILGDTRSLDEVVFELANMGYITSFCTAGYRCGRTGECIMDFLKTGKEGQLCKLNAILTYREWLDDFASPETKNVGEVVIAKEIEEVKEKNPEMFDLFMKYYEMVKQGHRDLYF